MCNPPPHPSLGITAPAPLPRTLFAS